MSNMDVWAALSQTPKEAQKPIQAGRLKGFTDINPMWRFKVLTQTFGTVGIGWKYEIVRTWLESGAEGEVKAMAEVNLYIRNGEAWSDAIPGLGGSSFVTKESKGLYTSDECYKMALTDAIGTACKALGMSADIYYDKDRTKYTAPAEPAATPKTFVCEQCGAEIRDVAFKSGAVKKTAEIIDFTKKTYGKPLCYKCMKEAMQSAT